MIVSKSNLASLDRNAISSRVQRQLIKMLVSLVATCISFSDNRIELVSFFRMRRQPISGHLRWNRMTLPSADPRRAHALCRMSAEVDSIFSNFRMRSAFALGHALWSKINGS